MIPKDAKQNVTTREMYVIGFFYKPALKVGHSFSIDLAA